MLCSGLVDAGGAHRIIARDTWNLVVLWSGTRVTCEMVSDGGGRFIQGGIVGLHTLSLLFMSLVAHDRATEDSHTTRREPGTTYTDTTEHNRTQPNATRGYSA